MFYQHDIFNYLHNFPSLPNYPKTPIYIDNTNTILFLNYPFSPIKNFFLNSISSIIYYFNTILLIPNKFISLNNITTLYVQIFVFISICLIFITILLKKYLINTKLSIKLEELEEKIKYLYKNEKHIVNDLEKYTLLNKKLQENIEKKMKYYEKEMKKIQKEINKYN
jgi:hypothetical protein